MNGNLHFVFGAGVGIGVALALGYPQDETVTLLATALIGSIFPDIDNPRSHMGQLSKPISTVIGAISEKMGKSGAKHRGMFHDPLFYFLLGGVAYFYDIRALIGFFIGVASHLFLDMFNYSGIPFIFGMSRLRLAKIDGNSKIATVLTAILFLIAVGSGAYINFFA